MSWDKWLKENGELPQDHLSPTQIGMWLRCGEQYRRRYVLGERLPPPGAIVQGTAVHAAAEVDLKHYLDKQEHLTEADVADIAASAFDSAAEDAEFQEGEEPGQLKDESVSLATTWRRELAPQVNPVAVEAEWSRDVGDIKLVGRVDVEESEKVWDWKTAGKRPSKGTAQSSFQFRAYAAATGKKVSAGYLIKNKTPVTEVQEADFGPEVVPVVDETVRQVASAIRAGIFPPRTDGWWCSPTMCGYFATCPFGQGRQPIISVRRASA